MPFLDGLGQQVFQQLDLAGFAAEALHDQGRMAADLAQLRQGGQHLRPPGGEGAVLDQAFHAHALLVQHGQIDLALLACHGDGNHRFHLVRQFRHHFFFQPAHQEGADAAQQVLRVLALIIAAHKIADVGQIAGHGEIKQAPQLRHVVFHRRAGKGQARAGLQALDRAGRLAQRVFNILGFIQHREAEGDVFKQVDVLANEGIAGQQQVGRVLSFTGSYLLLPVGAAAGDHLHRKLRGKLFQLTEPVVGQGGGHDDDAGQTLRLVFRRVADGGDGLHRFTQTHLVGQYAAHAQAVQGIQPMEAPLLIGVQAADGALGPFILGRSQAGRLGGDIHRQAGILDQRL